MAAEVFDLRVDAFRPSVAFLQLEDLDLKVGVSGEGSDQLVEAAGLGEVLDQREKVEGQAAAVSELIEVYADLIESYADLIESYAEVYADLIEVYAELIADLIEVYAEYPIESSDLTKIVEGQAVPASDLIEVYAGYPIESSDLTKIVEGQAVPASGLDMATETALGQAMGASESVVLDPKMVTS